MSISKVKLGLEQEGNKVIKGRGYVAEVKYSSFNQRIVVKSYQGNNLVSLGSRLAVEAWEKDYSKVWLKVKASDRNDFAKIGFVPEAKIKDFYIDEDAIIMAFYTREARSQEINKEKEEQIITDLMDLDKASSSPKLEENCKFKFADCTDVEAMAELYDEVFASYPVPIFERGYIRKGIKGNVIFGLMYKEGELVAAASAETDPELKNAEMTDFATLPNERGQGYASYILDKLEEELKNRDYNALYSIARAKSYGMNRVFKLAGYEYTGRLIQNCHIAGDFEDMNLWCKVIN